VCGEIYSRLATAPFASPKAPSGVDTTTVITSQFLLGQIPRHDLAVRRQGECGCPQIGELIGTTAATAARRYRGKP
jgi:hypothetical protein